MTPSEDPDCPKCGDPPEHVRCFDPECPSSAAAAGAAQAEEGGADVDALAEQIRQTFSVEQIDLLRHAMVGFHPEHLHHLRRDVLTALAKAQGVYRHSEAAGPQAEPEAKPVDQNPLSPGRKDR